MEGDGGRGREKRKKGKRKEGGGGREGERRRAGKGEEKLLNCLLKSVCHKPDKPRHFKPLNTQKENGFAFVSLIFVSKKQRKGMVSVSRRVSRKV